MKITCDSKKYYESIGNSEDKENFLKHYFSGKKTFENMPLIETTLYDAKTRTQNQCCWRDWGIAAKLMFTDKETIYYWLLKNPEFKDIWMEESTYGKNKKKSHRFVTMSGLTKEKVIDFIPRYRDFLQEIINKEYQTYVLINWSKFENINKPDYEINRE